jgi:hypothetical protein
MMFLVCISNGSRIDKWVTKLGCGKYVCTGEGPGHFCGGSTSATHLHLCDGCSTCVLQLYYSAPWLLQGELLCLLSMLYNF